MANTININLEINPKNPPTVEQLRRNGYKVRIQHFRYNRPDYIGEIPKPLHEKVIKSHGLHPQLKINPSNIHVKGGRTIMEITTPTGRDYSVESVCHINDNFNRRRAVKMCLGRFAKQVQKEMVG